MSNGAGRKTFKSEFTLSENSKFNTDNKFIIPYLNSHCISMSPFKYRYKGKSGISSEKVGRADSIPKLKFIDEVSMQIGRINSDGAVGLEPRDQVTQLSTCFNPKEDKNHLELVTHEVTGTDDKLVYLKSDRRNRQRETPEHLILKKTIQMLQEIFNDEPGATTKWGTNKSELAQDFELSQEEIKSSKIIKDNRPYRIEELATISNRTDPKEDLLTQRILFFYGAELVQYLEDSTLLDIESLNESKIFLVNGEPAKIIGQSRHAKQGFIKALEAQGVNDIESKLKIIDNSGKDFYVTPEYLDGLVSRARALNPHLAS